MQTRPRSIALVLVSLLLVSLAPSFPVAAENEAGNEPETGARSTGTEEISITLSSSATYFDRTDSSTTTQFTATVTSINLDENSEYNIVWNLCNGVAQHDSTGNSHYYTCGSTVDTSDSNINGEIDIGSGSSFQTTTFTFTDPGISSLENGLYGLKATLRISTVVMDTNSSEVFNLGGELETQGNYVSQVTVNQDFLLTDDISFGAMIVFDHAPLGFLTYNIDCSLFEDGVTTAVDTTTFVDRTSYWDMDDTSFSLGGNSYTLTATNGGTHHVECVVTRNADGTIMGTIVGNDFEVVDATVTGQEALSDPVIASTYYDRSDSTSSTSISFSFDATDLYVGTEYRIEWNLCNGVAQYDSTGNSHYYRCSSAVDATDSALTGSTTFIAAAATETQSFTFTDPGISGLENGLYGIGGELYVSTIELADNEGEVFNLGGELELQGTAGYTSAISVTKDFLLTDDISFSGTVAFDHAPLGFLKYTVDCSLFEHGVTGAVDTTTFLDRTTYWDMEEVAFGIYGVNSVNTLTATNGGTHHVECVVTRNVDGTNMGTIVGNDFEVVDATVTGQEALSDPVIASTYYDRSDSTSSTSISFSLEATNLHIGTEYRIEWNLCNGIAWDDFSNSHYYRCSSAVDATDSALTGSATFVAAATTETHSFTFTDPGLPGLENGLYGIGGELYVSTIELTSNEGEVFNLGGELETQGNYVSQVTVNQDFLLTDDISFGAMIVFDHAPLGFLTYNIDCSLFEDGVTTAVDTTTFVDRTSYWDMDDTSFSLGGNSYTLTATNGGTHHVECVVTRNADGTIMGTIVGNDFEVVDDTSNQDDATMTVAVNMHATEGWGTVTISAVDLDAGQEYKFDWAVHDNTANPPTVMMQNDHIWVEGNDGTHTYDLPFHDLADTTDACITVVFKAGTTELATDSTVCWISASTADGDGDGVYDKNDLCDNTPASATVQADGCSDSDGDGFDTTVETECGSDPLDATSMPTDLDGDGTCDALDLDTDGDGYLDADEVVAGTDPLDATSMPANALPTCAIYYSLEVDGMPTSFDGNAAIPALSGATAQAGVASLTPPVITVPNGSYYITAHCIDTDGDDITVTVNDVTVGPVPGEVSAGTIIVIGEDVDETLDVTVTWTDGTDTLTAIVTVELDGDASPTIIPGFTGLLASLSMLIAFAFIARREA